MENISPFLSDVLDGLRQTPKSIPCQYFYDERGSCLFDAICGLPEYYPTRTETALMRAHADEMARCLGPSCLLLEYGSGTSMKTCFLLDRMACPAGYVPIDIAREHLMRSASSLAAHYPHVEILPVCADYTRPFELPQPIVPPARTAVYFPGSTIGNFAPEAALQFLCGVAEVAGPGGGLLIGVDLKKPAAILEPAYDDAQGVTAAFNLNLLARINRELGADFDLDAFRHRAFYNAVAGRIEMHLESLNEQTVTLAGETFSFAQGETILTEYSHKYGLDEFAVLASAAGFQRVQVWVDAENLFSVQYFTVAA